MKAQRRINVLLAVLILAGFMSSCAKIQLINYEETSSSPSARLRFRYSSDIEDSAVAALQTMGDVMALEGAEEYGYMITKKSSLPISEFSEIVGLDEEVVKRVADMIFKNPDWDDETVANKAKWRQ